MKRMVYRVAHWWANRNGLRIVRAAHLDAIERECRRLRHGVCLPQLDSFGTERAERP